MKRRSRKELEQLLKAQSQTTLAVEERLRQKEAEHYAATSTRDRLERELNALRTRQESEHLYLRMTTGRGDNVLIYEGASAESFGQWCAEVLYPQLVSDARDLGSYARLSAEPAMVVR